MLHRGKNHVIAFVYCSLAYTMQLWWNTKKCILNRLHAVYHDILQMLLGVAKYESISFPFTLFDVQWCQSVNRNTDNRFMRRFNSSVNRIIKDIPVLYLPQRYPNTGSICCIWILDKNNYRVWSKYTSRSKYIVYSLADANIWTHIHI